MKYGGVKCQLPMLRAYLFDQVQVQRILELLLPS